MTKNHEANRLHLAWQPELRPAIPTVYGPVDYRVFRDQLIEIDRLLLHGGIENAFVAEVLESLPPGLDDRLLVRRAREASLALRCNIARKIKGASSRKFSVQVAESHLLQWFLGISALDAVRTPSKSSLDRFDKILPAERIEAFNRRVFAAACGEQSREDALGLCEGIELTDAFIDATCLKTGIHFPVDWVLLRDAARTLMKATACIRRHGLKNRMPRQPLAFLGAMNKHAMAMSAGARKAGAKRARKKILRAMKALVRTIERHARAHLKLLGEKRECTRLSEKQAGQIALRIENILAQLPAAIKQAHERIIGARLVKNEDKLLSLYEKHTRVIVRGKAGAEVEFGRELFLCETREGLIADYALPGPGEEGVKQTPACVERLKANNTRPKALWSDRGLNSKANAAHLEQNNIRNGLCERDPEKLRERLEQEEGYAEGLRRRGVTEARIAIVKNLFLGGVCRAKGEEHMKQTVGWAVLAHNLWVLARRELASKAEGQKEAH